MRFTFYSLSKSTVCMLLCALFRFDENGIGFVNYKLGKYTDILCIDLMCLWGNAKWSQSTVEFVLFVPKSFSFLKQYYIGCCG